MQQLCAGECEDRHGCGATLRGRKSGGSPGLVVVLDEPDHFLLVDRICKQVQAHTLGVPMFQPVIKFLVVAVVKTLLLQFLLEISVSLGDEPELWILPFDRRD